MCHCGVLPIQAAAACCMRCGEVHAVSLGGALAAAALLTPAAPRPEGRSLPACVVPPAVPLTWQAAAVPLRRSGVCAAAGRAPARSAGLPGLRRRHHALLGAQEVRARGDIPVPVCVHEGGETGRRAAVPFRSAGRREAQSAGSCVVIHAVWSAPAAGRTPPWTWRPARSPCCRRRWRARAAPRPAW